MMNYGFVSFQPSYVNFFLFFSGLFLGLVRGCVEVNVLEMQNLLFTALFIIMFN